ncbi:hypothetical protein [Hymenobacter sp. BT190]|uniref:hypothetical protein n=1 Tax=Hymenobacter sp. BT190 TaxID=2763505 RepID=UPI0016517325|nr:hypothetical protein [Hymenobacter sp. BT190]MBC6699362.1 hypothetical protein [Hymenobacter sp. BT190]
MRQLLCLLALCVLVMTGTHAISLPPEQRTTITSDDFISGLLETVSYEKLASTKYSKSSTPVKGGGKMIRFTNGSNTFSCFKSQYNAFTASFDITKPDPILTPFLKLGASKSEVLKKLGRLKGFNTVLVQDLEGMALVTLTFEKETLTKVSFRATID